MDGRLRIWFTSVAHAMSITVSRQRKEWKNKNKMARADKQDIVEFVGHEIQRSAKVGAPGCVIAAGKLGRSDELQQ